MSSTFCPYTIRHGVYNGLEWCIAKERIGRERREKRRKRGIEKRGRERGRETENELR